MRNEQGVRVHSKPMLQPGIPPPADYYRDNLLRVLEHVVHHHADLLSADEVDYIGKVRSIGREAQRLYARLITRKGPHIRSDRLNYREIGNHSHALETLTEAGLLEVNGAAPAATLLKLFTHRELANLFDARASTKMALLESILNARSGAAIRARLRRHSAWLRVIHTDCLELVQLLFFGGSGLGGAHGGLTVFVLEDLGAARFENYVISRSQRLFNNRNELRRYRLLRELNELAQQADAHPGLAGAVLAALGEVLPATTRWERRLADRTLNRLGRWYERRGYKRKALDCYVLSSSHPARERRVRILCRLGDRDAARALVDEIAAAPLSVQEKDFAVRFVQGNKGRTPPPTTVAMYRLGEGPPGENPVRVNVDAASVGFSNRCASPPSATASQDSGTLRARQGKFAVAGPPRAGKENFRQAADTLMLPPAASIESLALAWLTASGGEGWHLENHLPLGLAGLAFWDLIFAPMPGAFPNPYQAGPLDLFWEDFAELRREPLARAKAKLRDPARFAETLKTSYRDKHGIVNHLVSWRHWNENLLDRVIATIPHRVLFPLVCHVIENPRNSRAGFPDLLLLYDHRDYEFIEVKGPTDRLQPAQRAWFDYFRENGCNAWVLKFKRDHGQRLVRPWLQ